MIRRQCDRQRYLLVEEFLDVRERRVSVSFRSHKVHFISRRVGHVEVVVAIDEISNFKAVINCLDQIPTRFPEIRCVFNLIHHALRYSHRADLPSLFVHPTLCVKKCLRAVDPCAKFLNSFENQGGTGDGLYSSLRSSNVARSIVLPPRDQYRHEYTDDRKYSLRPCSLGLWFQRAKSNPFAAHVYAPVLREKA